MSIPAGVRRGAGAPRPRGVRLRAAAVPVLSALDTSVVTPTSAPA